MTEQERSLSERVAYLEGRVDELSKIVHRLAERSRTTGPPIKRTGE